MGRPSKPFKVIQTEGRSHRTKAELEHRRKEEEALASGIPLRERNEVKNNEYAHKEFVKVNKFLKKIGKNDALFENVINRYCLLLAECIEFEEMREKFYDRFKQFEALEQSILMNGEMTRAEFYKTIHGFESQIMSLDKQVMAKRKMLLDIEKENIMTINTVMRSIPKKEAAPSEDEDIRSILGSN